MDTLQVGCELKITEKAASVFKDMIADENKDIENSYLRVSGFLPNIPKPENLPIGTALKVVGFDDRGIVLEKL